MSDDFSSLDDSKENGEPPLQDDFSERKEFVEFTRRFIDLIVDYCMFTLDVFCRKKGSRLNESQAEDVVNFNLNFILQQIQDPEFLSIVREEAISRYEENSD
jgi:hypothetical protein